MSIRYSGVASRSFIIGIRLWPPAITRAPSCRASAARTPSTLVARSYSNGAGVCIWCLVLDGGVAADDGRALRALGDVEGAGGLAAVRGVAQRGAVRARHGDWGLA